MDSDLAGTELKILIPCQDIDSVFSNLNDLQTSFIETLLSRRCTTYMCFKHQTEFFFSLPQEWKHLSSHGDAKTKIPRWTIINLKYLKKNLFNNVKLAYIL